MGSKKLKLEWLLPYPNILFESEKGVWCVLCNTEFVCKKKYHVEQHVSGPNHLKRKESVELLKPEVLLLETDVSNTEFYMDLCEAFVAADIPLSKLKKPSLKAFLEKYCKRSIPDESTLRKKYVDKVYYKTMDRIRQSLTGKKLWVSIEETTDTKGRYVANIIVGPLNSAEPGESYLINSKFLLQINSDIITQAAVESLNSLILETNTVRENVVLMLSDNAAYMLKTGEQLKYYFPNLLHLTCLAHALHRISEMIRENYPLIDNLISEVNKIILKSPDRINTFKEMCSNITLPPQPVITRWGTWLSAVTYYNTNFWLIKNVVVSLKDDAQSIIKCKEIINTPDIKKDLAFICDHFGYIPDIIERLETESLPLLESYTLFETTIEKLKDPVPNAVGEKLTVHLQKNLKSNPGYSQLTDIIQRLKNQDNDQYEHFRYAPVTSCEIDRSFSRLRDFLNYKRTNFTEENFEKLLIISCNSHKV